MVGTVTGPVLDAALVEFVRIALEQRHAHIDAAHRARVLGRRLQGLLKGNVLVGEGKLHRLTRTAVGNGEHAGKTVVHHLLDAVHETRVRPGERGLLDLELGGHRAACADEAHVVQALLPAKVELLRAHVQTVQASDLGLGGPALQVLIRARAVVEQRTGLGQDDQRIAMDVRKRADRPLVHERQESLELRRDHTRLHQLEQRGELGVVLRGQIQCRGDALYGIVGEGKLAHGRDLDGILVADGLPG